jgi:hypothetical protein
VIISIIILTNNKNRFSRNQSFILYYRDCSSTISHTQNQLTNPRNCELLNIIHNELTKPSYHPSISTKHVAIQCSSDDFNSQINHSDSILIGRLSSSSTKSSIPPLPGYNECGIQVDLNDNNIDLLIQIYSNRLSTETIRQFYEVCHSDIQLTRTEIDEYLQHYYTNITSIPTLRQLSLNALNQWNEQIKSTNPLFDTKSIDDLLQDINDDEIFEELSLDNNSNIEVINSIQINISWSMINSLEELYGELPNKSLLSSDNNEISLPFDDDLSVSIYQALQRFLIKPNQTIKPVNENQIKKKKNNNNQKWKLPSQNQSNADIAPTNVPSLKQIMNEEQQAAKSKKSKKVFKFIFFFL